MKNYLLLFSFFSFLLSSSQSKESFDYQNLSAPDTNNELSLFFQKEIPQNLLKSITYPKNKSNLIISFIINKEDKPYNITFNSARNSKLNDALKKAFEKYSFKEQHPEIKFETNKKYSFQVISKNDNFNEINCSSKFIIETPPDCISCNDLDFYQDIISCINLEIKKHLYKSIDFSLADSVPNINVFEINLDLSINKKGGLSIDKIKSDDVFNTEINEAVKSFPNLISTSLVNGDFNTYKLSTYLKFKKGETPILDALEVSFDTVFEPNSTNDFAVYLSENLSKADIKKANLNRINDRLSIYFELDKKGKPFEITTTSRSKDLEEKVITLFKNYNLTKLNFVEKHNFNRYFISIIVFENNKNSIKTNSVVGYNRIPIFPKCEKSKSVKLAKQCFSYGIQKHFVKKFNSRIPNKLGLSAGRKRIFISFTINKKGNVSKIRVKAPHPKIKKEVIRVMKKIPRVKPAVFGRKPANIKYSIPFTLIVE
jgi:hypothetical protein